MDNPQTDLSTEVHDKIMALCAAGDELAEAEAYEAAIEQYNEAFDLLPNPKNDWDASTWILAAIADACFLSGYYTSAREALEYAMTCPEAIGNPFLHLRFGQVLFLAKDYDGAADELMRAYMAEGEEIFETEDPKYFAFLKTRAII
jgi:tetratricopeptide (TPR) repeat protein